MANIFCRKKMVVAEGDAVSVSDPGMQNMWCSDSHLVETLSFAVPDLSRAPHEQQHRRRNGSELEPALEGRHQQQCPLTLGSPRSIPCEDEQLGMRMACKTGVSNANSRTLFHSPTGLLTHMTNVQGLWWRYVFRASIWQSAKETQEAKGKHVLWPSCLQNMPVT